MRRIMLDRTRRTALAAGLVGIIALGGGVLSAAPASATPPRHFRFSFDVTFHDDFFSDACGFDVVDTESGKGDFALYYDKSGVLVREVDTFPAAKFSLAAPSTGRSIAFATPAVLISNYNDGGGVGTTGVAQLTGLQFMVEPGVMVAGRVVFDFVVVDISPEGIPFVEGTGVVSQSGTFFQGDVAPVVCDVLSEP